MEQLTLLAYVAAMTKKAKLLTSVMVVPHREPLLAAKSLATTDQLSGGRLIVGCGTGWMREEFDAIGADFDNRGAVTDDYIRIFKKVWTEDDPQHSSQWSTFPILLSGLSLFKNLILPYGLGASQVEHSAASQS